MLQPFEIHVALTKLHNNHKTNLQVAMLRCITLPPDPSQILTPQLWTPGPQTPEGRPQLFCPLPDQPLTAGRGLVFDKAVPDLFWVGKHTPVPTEVGFVFTSFFFLRSSWPFLGGKSPLPTESPTGTNMPHEKAGR